MENDAQKQINEMLEKAFPSSNNNPFLELLHRSAINVIYDSAMRRFIDKTQSVFENNGSIITDKNSDDIIKSANAITDIYNVILMGLTISLFAPDIFPDVLNKINERKNIIKNKHPDFEIEINESSCTKENIGSIINIALKMAIKELEMIFEVFK